MKEIYLTSYYLAPVQYYTKLLSDKIIYIESESNYIKQTYRNRCTIAGANGILVLSVPVIKPESIKARIKDIRISDHGNWRHQHWNSIESAYNSTPFFEYYRDDIQPFYEKRHEFLFDFNERLREIICSLLDIEPQIRYTSEYHTNYNPDTSLDLRETIHSKKDVISDPDFKPYSYYQVFLSKYGFLPNLSIIDLLFNMGPESLIVLRKSQNKKPEREQ